MATCPVGLAGAPPDIWRRQHDKLGTERPRHNRPVALRETTHVGVQYSGLGSYRRIGRRRSTLVGSIPVVEPAIYLAHPRAFTIGVSTSTL